MNNSGKSKKEKELENEVEELKKKLQESVWREEEMTKSWLASRTAWTKDLKIHEYQIVNLVELVQMKNRGILKGIDKADKRKIQENRKPMTAREREGIERKLHKELQDTLNKRLDESEILTRPSQPFLPGRQAS